MRLWKKCLVKHEDEKTGTKIAYEEKIDLLKQLYVPFGDLRLYSEAFENIKKEDEIQTQWEITQLFSINK